ncbi:MAG: hypothetical protein LBN27_05100 [Prevotellaceae bacterium]|jgi:hypothetical protein|nr:hypothetical protein [Prevotellaceae bacterium]
MSIFKTYLLDSKKARYAIQLEIGGRTRTISFVSVGYGTAYSSGKPIFSTKDENVQKAIEGSAQFLDGKIKVVESKDAGDASTSLSNRASTSFGSAQQPPLSNPASAQQLPLSNPASAATFENVTTFAQAKEVLCGEPYNLPKTGTGLSSAEKILAKAKELGVNFPNLKAE